MTSEIRLESGVTIPMRDGAKLAADIWHPKSQAPVSAILFRTPYNRTLLNSEFLRPQDAARAGFAAVVQDTRGRFDSEGDWAPGMWAQEGEDGYDTVEWIADQAWCSGAVGMSGPSYLAIAQLAAAALSPPHLKAIAPAMATTLEDEIAETGGAVRLDHLISWAAFMALDWMRKREAEGRPLHPTHAAVILAAAMDPRAVMDHRPLREAPLFGVPDLPISFDALFGAADATALAARAFQLPCLNVGGWYDVFARSTVAQHGRQVRSGREDSHLLMGCWTHGGTLPQQHGEVNFGLAASGGGGRIADLHLEFFRKYLDGEPSGLAPVRFFLAGANAWEEAQTWPPAGARNESVPLMGPGDTDGGAFEYDPMNPTPTVGGRTLYIGGLAMGPIDQRKMDGRTDFIRYVTEPCEEPLEMVGPVAVRLRVQSSTEDTDIVAKLLVRDGGGELLPLCEGALRLSFRDGLDRPRPMAPDHPVDVSISLGDVAWRTRTGARLVLQIQSANYPHLDPNMNAICPFGSLACGEPAKTTIWHRGGVSKVELSMRSEKAPAAFTLWERGDILALPANHP